MVKSCLFDRCRRTHGCTALIHGLNLDFRCLQTQVPSFQSNCRKPLVLLPKESYDSFLPDNPKKSILGVLIYEQNSAVLYLTENPPHEVHAVRPNGLLPPVSTFCWKLRKSTKFMGTALKKQPNLSFPVFDIFFILLLHTAWLQIQRGLEQRLEPTAGWPRSKPAQVFCTFFAVRISLICRSETMLNKFAFQQLLQSLELCICFRLFCCCCFGNFIQTPSNGASFGETWTSGITMHRTCITRCCIQRLAVIPLSTCLWVALFSSANACCTYFSSPATSRHR